MPVQENIRYSHTHTERRKIKRWKDTVRAGLLCRTLVIYRSAARRVLIIITCILMTNKYKHRFTRVICRFGILDGVLRYQGACFTDLLPNLTPARQEGRGCASSMGMIKSSLLLDVRWGPAISFFSWTVLHLLLGFTRLKERSFSFMVGAHARTRAQNEAPMISLFSIMHQTIRG